MKSLTRIVPALVLLSLAACGDDLGNLGGLAGDGRVVADTSYFENQFFDCDPATPAPDCPPFACDVDESGAVSNCSEHGCGFDTNRTTTAFAFTGPSGVDLCVPASCNVGIDGAVESCEQRCSEDDTTVYYFEFACE